MESVRCNMKGYLNFLVLWMIYNGKATGSEIAVEIEKRRGHKPSPGTIYPVLKDLKQKEMVKASRGKEYTLTVKGKRELESQIEMFISIFSDFNDIKSCCRKGCK